MLKMPFASLVLLCSLAVAGCATKLQPDAEKIQTISASQKSHCKFLGSISTQQKLGPDKPGNAYKKALNRVNEVGGNSLYVISTSSDWAEGASLVGEACKCGK